VKTLKKHPEKKLNYQSTPEPDNPVLGQSLGKRLEKAEWTKPIFKVLIIPTTSSVKSWFFYAVFPKSCSLNKKQPIIEKLVSEAEKIK
jgi:hypothetical protein